MSNFIKIINYHLPEKQKNIHIGVAAEALYILLNNTDYKPYVRDQHCWLQNSKGEVLDPMDGTHTVYYFEGTPAIFSSMSSETKKEIEKLALNKKLKNFGEKNTKSAQTLVRAVELKKPSERLNNHFTHSCATQTVDYIKDLVDMGADTSNQDYLGMKMAAQNGNLPVFEYLLTRPDLQSRDCSESINFSFRVACLNGKEDIAFFMIHQKIINQQDVQQFFLEYNFNIKERVLELFTSMSEKNLLAKSILTLKTNPNTLKI